MIEESKEHFPIEDQPKTDFEFGVNYGARRIRAYMDLADFDHELGAARGGNRVFPSIEDLREHKKDCIDECGIVEVEITLYRVIQWRKENS